MNPLALAAVGWLEKAIVVVSAVVKKIRGNVVKVKKYLRDLVRLEQTAGADTELWSKLERIANGEAVVITQADAQYGVDFKILWDRYFKKALNRLAQMFDADGDGILDMDEDDD
jgi:hypothetical protein